MLDLSLLRLLKYRSNYNKLMGRVPEASMDRTTLKILKDYGKYFNKFPDHDKVDLMVFLPLFRAWNSNLSDEQRAEYDRLFQRTTRDLTEQETSQVMRAQLELRLATDLANVAARFAEGEVPDIFSVIHRSIEDFKSDSSAAGIKPVDDAIEDLLKEDENNDGLRWRLGCLNESIRPLRPGDWIGIAGRPDRGKTTFIASELTFLAAQLPPGREALWLNNEGMGRRIKPRLYEAALGLDRNGLIELSNRGLLRPAYEKVMGSVDRIKIFDIHRMDNVSVEQIIEENDPAIVVYDMIDNIRGFGDAARTDLKLEQMYSWARDMAAMHQHVGIATSQLSADAEGLAHPTQDMLKDSKTGKQGTFDALIMIGARNDPGYANIRYMNVTKNKLRTARGVSDPQAQVAYETRRARYTDLSEVMESTDV